MSPTFRFVVTSLAVWRMTHLLAYEEGPFRVFARFRERVRTTFGETLLDCFSCLSLWVAGGIAPLAGVGGSQLLLVSALSAAAIGVEHHIGEQGELQEVQE